MLRLANRNDIDSINNLGIQVNSNFIELFNIEEILNSKYDKLSVYEINQQVVGFIHIIELDETVDIINIVVDIKYRHQGIASLLMDYMITGVKSSIKSFTLEVSVNNEYAIKLYEKYGFKVFNIRKGYYHGIDAYLMGKEVIK